MLRKKFIYFSIFLALNSLFFVSYGKDKMILKHGYLHIDLYLDDTDLVSDWKKYYFKGQEIKLKEEEIKILKSKNLIEEKILKGVNRAKLKEILNTKIKPKIDIKGTKNIIKLGKDGKGEFSNNDFLTESLDLDLAVLVLEKAIKEGIKEVELHVISNYEIEFSKDLENMGFDGIISVGQSDFSNSSSSRINNIKTAASRFNGVIIKPGETFSFNKNLGEVNGKTGFLPELVIKKNSVEKEFGGGVCQVSTTLYRSIMEGGIEIKDRRNHSFAVNHYAPQGSDATIYLGNQDFKFQNNLKHSIMLQYSKKGNILRFVVYGNKKDKKDVSYFGPYISNYTGTPAPVYQIDPGLAPGQKKFVLGGQGGFKSTWFRIVNGKIEKIVSRYSAVPTTYKIGPEKVETPKTSQ